MKICFLTAWLPPRIDGVGDYTWNLTCALRYAGVDVSLFASDQIKQWQPKVVVKALKTAVENRIDWLCLQYVPQMYGRWGICWQVADILLALKKEFKCKIAVTFHEFVSGWQIWPKNLFLNSISRLQTKRILSVIDLAVTTCSRYQDTLQHLTPQPLPIAVIPVGSNVEPVSLSSEKLNLFRNKIFPEGSKVLGLFSRLSTTRNFPLALKTLKQAREQGLDVWLYLLGYVESSNSKLFPETMRLADRLGVKSYIALSGELPKEDLSVQLRLVDVFIFPQCDGISTRNTALMAAMAHGLPIVSFKPESGNFANFHIPCSLLVDRGNEKNFMQITVESLKQSDALSKTAQANSDYYAQHFSWTIIAQEYLKVLGA